MSTNTRTQEIISSMTTFSKAAYHRSEVLPELFALQDEIVKLTFNGEHAEMANLRIWDIERHLEQMNEELGGVATEELRIFENGCKDLCNMIKMEISGNKGESKAFRSLERLRCQNRVLRNVELTEEDARTELDAAVITQKGVFIVEVKNTSKDIFIDEEGKYFRTGEFLKFDCHIAEKMSVKETLLKDVLKKGGFPNVPIFGVVVFTDNRIQVRNRYQHLNTCFLSQLPYIIQEHTGYDVFSVVQLNEVAQVIEAARCEETYPLKIDVPQFKHDFAVLMAKLESASAEEQIVAETADTVEIESENLAMDEPEVLEWSLVSALRSVLKSRYFRTAASTAAAFAITFATTAIATKHTI